MPKGFKKHPVTGEIIPAFAKVNIDYPGMLNQYLDHLKQGVFIIPFKYAEIKGLNPAQCSYFANEFINKIEGFWEKVLLITRKYYHRNSILVDEALLKRCSTGDPAAIKLYYQKLENWMVESPIHQSNQTVIIISDKLLTEREKIDLKEIEMKASSKVEMIDAQNEENELKDDDKTT
jgi:hypothetical protein